MGDAGRQPSIPKVFLGKSVLITGVTGFVGKVLLEKLLRCCPGVDRVYVLLRAKRGEGVRQRMKELVSMKFFERYRAERGEIRWCCGAEEERNFSEKDGKGRLEGDNRATVVAVAGDVSDLDLGLSRVDAEALEAHVSVVFHVAATVRFNEPLRMSVMLNTRGTREMLSLARRMPRLEAFVHVSTAYAHVTNSCGATIEERFYDVPMEPEELIEAAEEMNEEDFQEVIERQAKHYENTYLCTKAHAEKIIENDYGDLPVSILRPGIVLSTHREPMPGWSEGFQGVSLCIAGSATGMIGVLLCDGKVVPEIVPVDHVVNAMLSIAWASMVYGKEGANKGNEVAENGGKDADKRVPIYNFVKSKANRVTWNRCRLQINRALLVAPEAKTLWKSVHFTRSEFIYNASSFVRQCLTRTLDVVQGLRGKASRMSVTQQKMKGAMDLLAFFMNNQFEFSDINLKRLREKASKEGAWENDGFFDFDTSTIDWDDYIFHYAKYAASNVIPQNTVGEKSSLKGLQLLGKLICIARVTAVLLSSATIFLACSTIHGFYKKYLSLESGQLSN